MDPPPGLWLLSNHNNLLARRQGSPLEHRGDSDKARGECLIRQRKIHQLIPWSQRKLFYQWDLLCSVVVVVASLSLTPWVVCDTLIIENPQVGMRTSSNRNGTKFSLKPERLFTLSPAKSTQSVGRADNVGKWTCDKLERGVFQYALCYYTLNNQRRVRFLSEEQWWWCSPICSTSPNIPDPGRKFAVWGRRKCKQAVADVAHIEITVILFFVCTIIGWGLIYYKALFGVDFW